MTRREVPPSIYIPQQRLHDSMDVEQALLSPSVQRALPNLASLHETVGFDSFVQNPPPSITPDPDFIRENLRGYAVQLERHERFTDIWKHQYANQLMSLQRLIISFDTRRKELESSSQLAFEPGELEQMVLGLPEFEDLYYFLACKTRTLYSDLQLRFVSKFVDLDTVLHRRGSSSFGKGDCTVRDVRNFLRAVWFHLLHPTVVRGIEGAINHRKYQALKANPLVPRWNVGQHSPEEQDAAEYFKRGLNLEGSLLGSMFEHLDDVSAISVPSMLLKVSRRTIGLGILHASDEEHMSSQSSHAGSHPRWDVGLIERRGEVPSQVEQKTFETERLVGAEVVDRAARLGESINQVWHLEPPALEFMPQSPGLAQPHATDSRARNSLPPTVMPERDATLNKVSHRAASSESAIGVPNFESTKKVSLWLPQINNGHSRLSIDAVVKVPRKSIETLHSSSRQQFLTYKEGRTRTTHGTGSRIGGWSAPNTPAAVKETSDMRANDVSPSPGYGSKASQLADSLSPVTNEASNAQPRETALPTRGAGSPPGRSSGFTTPRTNRVTNSSTLSTPPHLRMPFHGSAQFHQEPPMPPPKTEEQQASARKRKEAAEERMRKLQRDNDSKMQAVLQQVQMLEREKSELQERLSQANSPRPQSRSVLRRLSQLGSRARSKSPAKKRAARKSEGDLALQR